MTPTALETTSWSWPETILALGVMFMVVTLLFGALAGWIEFRKTRLLGQKDEELRQLVRRYEHLAETTVDSQQRLTTDVAELRARATAIEQILRTVE